MGIVQLVSRFLTSLSGCVWDAKFAYSLIQKGDVFFDWNV